MRPTAALAVLGLLASVASAAGVEVNATLDAEGAGDVVFVIQTSPADDEKLSAATGPELRQTLLGQLLVSPDRPLETLMETQGFNVRSISSNIRDGRRKTLIKAGVNSVAALAIGGGHLTLSKKEGDFVDLEGELGGAMAEHKEQLPPMADVDVKLTIVFDGTVLSADAPWKPAHSGEAVTYRDTADRLLSFRLPVRVRIRPHVEETTTFWTLLILGVVVLVVLGTGIILQRGREAIRTEKAA